MDITVKEIQEWLIKFTKEINENKSYLSDLDTPIGDGDHGNNMGEVFPHLKTPLRKRNRQQSVTPLKFFQWQ